MLNITDALDGLIDVLPPHAAEALRQRTNNFELLEIVLDLGRPPEARYSDEEIVLSDREVSQEDIEYVISRISEFTADNRAGIERTLHRISCIRNRQSRVVGLTCRVGRAVFGTIRIIEDLVRDGKSVLLLGRPGIGKTTMLREVARYLADEMNRRVVVVDTSNEIAGDGDVPHPAIGRARRMQVPSTPEQHRVMIEAVENHMPQVIIIDEMSTVEEAFAARTIAERGVQLIATAHGNTLENLISNPSLSDLIGGTQAVTLGDVEARRRRSQKTVIERKQRPTFNVIVEINDWNNVGVHRNTAAVVDDILRGYAARPELRWLGNNGDLQQEQGDSATRGGGIPLESPAPKPEPEPAPEPPREPEITRIVAFGIPRPLMEEEVSRLNAAVEMVKDLDDADMLVTTKSHYSRRPRAVRTAEENGMAVYVLRKQSREQIRQFLRGFTRSLIRDEETDATPSRGARRGAHQNGQGNAMQETEVGVRRIQAGESSVELAPQSAFVRRLQHSLAGRSNVGSSSVGSEPERRVVLRRRQR